MQNRAFIKNRLLFIAFILISMHPGWTQLRCKLENTDHAFLRQDSKQTTINPRSRYECTLVFHILYSNDEENISRSQILSQLEILNEVFNNDNPVADLNIPIEFRHLKTNPDIRFCLAETDPSGQPTKGITRTQIPNIAIACKREFGRRSIMHISLGGVAPWDTHRYINIYVVNRDQCNALGEAIYPWDATTDEDGIIIDYRALGFIGTAVENIPFHQGKTLVHEMGHYFGLRHLSDDDKHCNGDDGVSDTPVQLEFFGCPEFPQISCGNLAMYMNYMGTVNDACMNLFTKGQVERMHQFLLQYRSELLINTCVDKPLADIDKLYCIYNMDNWQIQNEMNLPWNAMLELFDMQGRLIWTGENVQHVSMSFPRLSTPLLPGIYILRIFKEDQSRIFKLQKKAQ